MIKVSVLVLILVLAGRAGAAQFDAPDLNLEIEIHRQFLKTRVPEGLPTIAAGEDVGRIESYGLQGGENLWSLSQMLYGDGAYWPRVWAQNRSITNPHLIRRGHTLQFLLGSEDEAPSFRFSENDESGLELAAATSTSTTGGNPQVQVPPPTNEPRPVLKVPNSFPEWQQVFRKRPDHFKIDDSRLGLRRHHEPDKIPLSAYVQEAPVESDGSFLEVEKESGLPVAMQYVYVKIKKGRGHVGEKLLMVKDHGVIRKLNEQVEGRITARFVQVFGDVELTELANSAFKSKWDTKEFDVYRALLTHAINLSLSEFDLIPGQVQIVDMGRGGPMGTTTAQVIGSAKSYSSALYGTGDIVFLNKGAKDGVQVGQILDLYIDRTIRDSETPVGISNASSGSLKIAKVSETCATAIILDAIDSIQQGDRAQQRVASRGSIIEGAGPGPRDELEFETPSGNPAAPNPDDDFGPPPISNSGDELELSE